MFLLWHTTPFQQKEDTENFQTDFYHKVIKRPSVFFHLYFISALVHFPVTPVTSFDTFCPSLQLGYSAVQWKGKR